MQASSAALQDVAELPETTMNVDPHAPFDPTASSSSHTPPPAAAPPSGKRKVFSNADFYASHFEAHVASVAAHFRGEPADAPAARDVHLYSNASRFPSRHFRWSEQDKNLFFASLRRRGKSWPDLIAADMAGRKSLVEVTAYLERLDGAFGALPEERRALVRVPLPPAREVSERWVEFEEDMASDYLDRTRKRERADEVGAREAERAQALKRVHRTLPPAPWTLPGAGPKTSKQKYRRNKQSKAAKKELEREHARQDWLELLDKDKAIALGHEMKHPSRLSDVQPGSDDDDGDEPQQAASDVQANSGPPLAEVTFEGDPPPESSLAAAAAKQKARIPWRGGKLRREVVVMGLGDIVREKKLDLLSFRVAHERLSRNPFEGQEPLQVPLALLETATALVRAHVSRILQHALALKPPDQDSEVDSAADLKPAAGARLITRKSVYEALISIQGAERDHWVDDVDGQLPSSTMPSPELPTSSLRAMSAASEDDSDVATVDDEHAQPMASVASPPPSAAPVSPAPADDGARPHGHSVIYRAAQPAVGPPPIGVVLVPGETKDPPPATFFKEAHPDDLIAASDDEGGETNAEEDQADGRQDADDLAADRAWENGLWATIGDMDADGLAWLTLGNLVDTVNVELPAVHVVSDEGEDGSDGSDADMDDDDDDGFRRSSQYSATPPPRAKGERRA